MRIKITDSLLVNISDVKPPHMFRLPKGEDAYMRCCAGTDVKIWPRDQKHVDALFACVALRSGRLYIYPSDKKVIPLTQINSLTLLEGQRLGD